MMVSSEDLRGSVVCWEPSASPLELRLCVKGTGVGRISASPDLKPTALVEIAGVALRIAWTEHGFYRVVAADSGLAVGEARFLPWRRDTFQARMGHLRAYRLQRPSPGTATWETGGAAVMEFRDREATVSTAINAADAPALLALGILLWRETPAR